MSTAPDSPSTSTIPLDPLQFLTDQYVRRREKNPMYSIRSFARDIGISPTQLSRVLNGQRKITYRQMSRILSALNISEEASRQIISRIILQAGEKAKVSRVLRNSFQPKFEGQSQAAEVSYFPVERFRMLSQWYHCAILELSFVEGFQSNPEWIAKTLKISVVEAKDAIQRMLKLGFLKEDESGRLVKSERTILFETKTSDIEIRKFETSMLEKAIEELTRSDQRSFDTRLINSITFPTSPESIPALKQAILEFQRKILGLIRNHQYAEVYHFGCQLFPVSDVSKKRDIGASPAIAAPDNQFGTA